MTQPSRSAPVMSQPHSGAARKALLFAAIGAVAVASCGGVRGPSPSRTEGPPRTTTFPETSLLPPSASATAQPAPAGEIVFYRPDGATWPPPAFMIDPDGSHETALHDGGLLPGIWSPDGARLVVPHEVTDRSPLPGAEPEWIRPALVNTDGSGFRVLDSYPDRNMHLLPIAWSADGARIFVFSGVDAVRHADQGLYTVRASDGGDLTSVLRTASGDKDFIHVSPDGTRLLIRREVSGGDRIVLVINPDGTGAHQVSTSDMVPVDLDGYWFNFDGPLPSEAWSPDGRAVAFTAYLITAGSTGLFITSPDGTGLHEIVPIDVGATSVQWSPDATMLAFTSRLSYQPQVWVVRPDGSGLVQLTDGADGSTSITPVWSPDGRKLLFQRKANGQVTLWTMNADGTDQRQLSPTPVGSDYVGGYAWWPAPRSQ
jgi:Tol biopolymer transport system component